MHRDSMMTTPNDTLGRLIAWSRDRTMPLHLDLGCGTGRFLHQAAAQLPDHRFVGIEIDGVRAARSANRVSSQQNALVVAGDAHFVLPMLPRGSVSYAHLYFPTPPRWNTTSDSLLDGKVFAELHRAMTGGAVLRLATDVRAAFELGNNLLLQEAFVPTTWMPPLPALPRGLLVNSDLELTSRRAHAFINFSQFIKHG